MSAAITRLSKPLLFQIYLLLRDAIPTEFGENFTSGVLKNKLLHYFQSNLIGGENPVGACDTASALLQRIIQQDEDSDTSSQVGGSDKSSDSSGAGAAARSSVGKEGSDDEESDIEYFSDAAESDENEDESDDMEEGAALAGRTADSSSSFTAELVPPVTAIDDVKVAEREHRHQCNATNSMSYASDSTDLKYLFEVAAHGYGLEKLKLVWVPLREKPFTTCTPGSPAYNRITNGLGFYMNFVTEVIPTQVLRIILSA